MTSTSLFLVARNRGVSPSFERDSRLAPLATSIEMIEME